MLEPSRWISVCRPRKQAQLAQNDGPENIAERVNQILEQALRQRASDIHIEPTETHLRIRLRVDGVLHALPLLAPELAAPVIARLKVWPVSISPSTVYRRMASSR